MSYDCVCYVCACYILSYDYVGYIMSYGCVCCIMSSAALLTFLEQNSLMLHHHKPECLVTFGSVVMCGCNVSSVVAAFPY